MGLVKGAGLSRAAVLAGGLLVALLLLDVASLLLPPLGRLGVVLWWLSWLALGVHAASCLRRTIAEARATGQGWVTLAVIAALVVLVFSGTLDSRLVHFETCHELGCAVGHFATDPGWGFNCTCLFDYPARQFLVPALPTLLLGPGYFALTFGSFLCFLVALPIFARGLLDLLAGRRHADLVTALILTFPLHLHYFNHFMFSYEESIYPFLNATIFTGLALQAGKRGDPALLPLIGLGMLHMVWGYTPSLALFGLAALWLLHRLAADPVRSPVERWSAALVLTLTTASLALSFLVRSDVHAIGERGAGELLADVGETIRHVLWFPPSLDPAFMSAFLYPFVVLALLGALAFFDGWRGVVVAAWVVGVLLASVILPGTSYYNVAFRVHRWLVAFPQLFALLAAFASRLAAPPRWALRLLALVLAVSVITGAAFHYACVWTRPPSRQFTLARFLEQRLPHGDAPDSLLLVTELTAVDENVRVAYANHWQFLLYLRPDVDGTAVVSDEGGCPEVRERAVDPAGRLLFLLAPAGQPAGRCFPAARLESLDRFRFDDDPPLELHRVILETPPAR